MDILSDAVKIGLGAIIGGGFAVIVAVISGGVTYIAAKQSHKTELAKLEREHRNSIGKMEFGRRTKLLTDVASALENVMTTFAKYSIHLDSISRQAHEGIRAESDPNTSEVAKAYREGEIANAIEEAIQMRLKIHAMIHDLLTEQSHLMLLGEDACRGRMEMFVKTIQAVAEDYGFPGKNLNMSNFEANSVRVRDARAAFYKEMQSAFKRH
jgi:formiminotetrahydrofolate cyclodeaminase